MQTKRAQTGFIGEYYIYSELIKNNKSCFITLGNAKSVDLIIITKHKIAHFIDVKSTRTSMKNTHKHSGYDVSMGTLGRWQLSIKIFWETHGNNPERQAHIFTDYYIFHNVNRPDRNIIVTGKELEKAMHKKIDNYLSKKNITVIAQKQICNWDICDLCFGANIIYNNWNKLP